ncbi:TetR family transcriptional regulator [Actinophytocola sp.]|uniref:TetR family transcriptional regulator n=1 Tax=Actinophytocola sp. TaxID=1872138 RepID=UPI002D80B09E|nr:TetR family transcriptional regulator [Actinophytocola sp.]HET9137916.1 TetR family transcriptional regulator [Actinophytocola sp.]
MPEDPAPENPAPPDTRARILQAALAEFGTRGFHATSVREIAERVGVTKTAVLYHFPSKADILAALTEPMLIDMTAATDAAAARPDPEAVRWTALERLLEVFLAHRHLIRMNLQDLAMVGNSAVFRRFRDGMMLANTLVAGPEPDFVRQVRAAQAIAMLGDPVVLFADAPTEDLRRAVLDGVRRLLGTTGPAASRSRGRPSVVSPEMARAARLRHAEGATAAEIAAELGISRATVYRHLGGD